MIDIVDFFKQQIEVWNQEGLGNKQWVYSAPLKDDALNKYQVRAGDEEKVHVFLTNLRISVNSQYASRTNMKNGETQNFTFDLNVLLQDELGMNTYNEIPDHPLTESRWEKIYKPLQVALTQDQILRVCEIIGIPAEIRSWNMYTRILWNDSNWSGWTVSTTLTFQQ